MTDWEDDLFTDEKTEEDVIELTDIVESSLDSGLDIGMDDTVIELTDMVGQERATLAPTETDSKITIDKSLFEDVPVVPAMTAGEGAPAQGLNLTPEQIDAALERVIEKQYADRIQTILFQVMEKVIEKEIAGIKESLQKDLDQIGTV